MENAPATQTPVSVLPKVDIQDTKDLRGFLVAQMNAAANGDVDVSRAKAVTNFAQQIYNTLNIELKAALVRAKIGDTKIKAVMFADE